MSKKSTLEEKLKKMEDAGKKMEETGKNMNKLGNKLIIMLTIPLVLMFFFGVWGLLGGVVLAVLVGAGNK